MLLIFKVLLNLHYLLSSLFCFTKRNCNQKQFTLMNNTAPLLAGYTVLYSSGTQPGLLVSFVTL